MKPEKIKGRIHMGNGVYSMAQCYELHQLLDECFEQMSGIEQEGGMGYAPNEDNIMTSELHIRHCLNKIVLGVSGKKLPNDFFKD